MANAASRFLDVSTPLGPDALVPVAFIGREEISTPFEFTLELVQGTAAVDPTALVGKYVAFALTPQKGDQRDFGGFVKRFAYAGIDGKGRSRYRAELVSWLWFLKKRSNYRIYQEKTVLEIVESVFADAGFDAYETAGVSGKYPAYEYCVQMGETDFDFVSRLLEEEGIFYFFRFEKNRHVLVLGDSKACYTECARAQVQFTSSAPSTEQVDGWEHGYEFVSGKWAHTDYDFKAPTTSLLKQIGTVLSIPSADACERYEYPGRYTTANHGEGKLRVRMEAEEATYDVVQGSGGCPDFTLGAKFKLEHPRYERDDGKAFVLTAIEHAATDEGGESSGYTNRFRCVPDTVILRPKRNTPRPIVHGPQTAMVVGPSSEEIHTDEHGRIKVQFHWDRKGARDDKSSCWIRVAQSTAGKKWGFQVLPRVGQEVVVEFLDGDPDRPLVTGAVYNANTGPAYDLPANKTQSGFRSRSTKGGATNALNELRFEDKKGSEHIFLHAQKDEHHRVLNDLLEFVGRDEHRTVKRHVKTKVEGDQHHTHDGDEMEKIKGTRSTEIGGDRKTKIAGADHLTVGGDHLSKIGGEHGLKIAGAQKTKADQDIHADAGMNLYLKAGMDYAVEAGMNAHVKGGMNVVVEAGMMLTLKAGPGFITIGPSGVMISGPMVMINSGGSAGAGSGSKPKAPAAPAAPDAPEAPTAPLEVIASADPNAASAAGAPAEKGVEAEWRAIESAPPSQQSAALESAAADGRPFCEECQGA